MGALADEIVRQHKKAAELLEQARAHEEQATLLGKLSGLYPDLRVHVGRWEKRAYCSSKVNEKVTRFDMRHNCGCCPDSPLEIWPYAETPLGPVYSDPPMFRVGERSEYGDTPRSGWDAELRAARIPEEIIGAIRMHFKKCADDARERITDLFENGVSEIEPFV